mgnify:CR=1 FL=1
MTLYQSLRLLAPELVLFAAAFVVLGIELVWRDRQKPWLPYAALAGLAGAAAATALLWGEALTGLEGVYAADSFAVFMKWIALGCAGLVVLSAGKFMQERTPYQGEFYFLLLLATLGITVVASATNLLLIFLAIELVSFSSYILTGYIRTASSEGAIKYFLYGAVASAVMLYGMSLIYGVTGSVQLNEIAAVFDAVSIAEKQHEKRYNDFRANIEGKKVFKRDDPVTWRCINCGYLFEGTEPPQKCPACAHPQSYFELLGENW